jgi:capsular polysaccharide biosynthesis protein
MKVEAEEITEEVRLDNYLSAVWRRKWLILLAALAAALVAAWAAGRRPSAYTAAALIEVGRVWKEPLQDHYATKEIINGAGFSHELAGRLGVAPDRLSRSIRADVITAGPRRSSYPILVRVVATAESAEQAARFAEAVADEVVSRHEEIFRTALAARLDQQRRLEERLSEISPSAPPEALRQLEAELVDVRAKNSPPVTDMTRVVNEVVPEGVAKEPIWRKVLAAAAIAALVVVAAAALAEFLRPAARKNAAGLPG